MQVMPDVYLPPEINREIHAWEVQQRFNPVGWEKVENNLRMTKIRRTIPVTSHYYANFHGRRPDYQ
jgi:hypothetical protein